MRRVMYISRSHVANDPDALDAIVQTSSIRNAAAGISGMFWSGPDEFVQALEGEYGQVGDTMKRIAADTRHGEIEIICDCTVRSRLFEAWAMVRSMLGRLVPSARPISSATLASSTHRRLVGLSSYYCPTKDTDDRACRALGE